METEKKQNFSTVERWISANSDLSNFGDALKTLVSYACVEWFRRTTGEILDSSEALSRVLLARLPQFRIAEWLENPKDHCPEIADFCDKIKTLPLPDALKKEPSDKLDLRGVQCPMNAVRSRLVMSGYPAQKTLNIYLDDGSPIENVPGALVADGHQVLSREKKDGYWHLKVVKPLNKE